MADITISLSNIHNTKSVLIEPLGEFKVRKLGAGEELDLSKKLRRLSKIIDLLDAIDYESLRKKKPTKEDRAEMEKISSKADKLMLEINEIKEFELMTYRRCFDDGVGGKKSDELFKSLSAEERTELFRQIFNPTVLAEEVEAPETPEVTQPEGEKDA